MTTSHDAAREFLGGHARRGSAHRLLLGLLLAVPAACRTYEPAPIDLDRLEQVFRDRTPMPTASRPDDTTATLDLADAEATAVLFNADLRRRRAAVGVAEATAVHAGLWPDPVVGLEFTRLLESAARPNEVFGTVGLTLPISGRLDVEKKRLGRAHAATLVELEVAEWRVRMDVRDAWCRWSALVAEAASTARLVAAMDDLLTVVAALEEVAELSRVEARLFRLARLQADLERTDVVARRDAARIELLGLLGLPPGISIDLRPSAVGSAGEPPSIPRTIEPRTTPDVRIALARHEIAEAALEQEIREQYPDLGTTPGYGTRDGVRQFSLGLSLPIPIVNGNRQAIETALASRTAAAVAVEQALERTASALAAATVVRDQAQRRVTIVETELVPLVTAQFDETRELARLGQVDTLILLDGLEQQRLATIQRIRTWRDLIIATNAVDALAGPDVRPTSGSTPEDAPSSKDAP